MTKIALKKGNSNKIQLKKVAPSLKKVLMKFNWTSDVKLDLDCSALLCRTNARGIPEVLSPQHIVFYAATNAFDPSRSVFYGGDVRDGTGDFETIDINLETVPAEVTEIAFVLTIDDASGKQTFGHAKSGVLELLNQETNDVILTFDFLEDAHNQKTIIHVASLKRDANGGWDVEGFGTGLPGSILDAFLAFGADEAWFEG